MGHETDHCIADYVADVRAPTPSAAAEIVIAEKNQLIEYLNNLRKRMLQTLTALIHKDRHRLRSLSLHPLITHPKKIIEWRSQSLDDFSTEIKRALNYHLQLKKQALDAKTKQVFALKPINQLLHFRKLLQERALNLKQAMDRKRYAQEELLKYMTIRLHQVWTKLHLHRQNLLSKERLFKQIDQLITEKYYQNKQKLATVVRLFEALDPKNLLTKGYSILFTENKLSVINSVNTIKIGMQGRLLLSDGELLVTINQINSDK